MISFIDFLQVSPQLLAHIIVDPKKNRYEFMCEVDLQSAGTNQKQLRKILKTLKLLKKLCDLVQLLHEFCDIISKQVWPQKALGMCAQEPPVIFTHILLFARFCDSISQLYIFYNVTYTVLIVMHIV